MKPWNTSTSETEYLSYQRDRGEVKQNQRFKGRKYVWKEITMVLTTLQRTDSVEEKTWKLYSSGVKEGCR